MNNEIVSQENLVYQKPKLMNDTTMLLIRSAAMPITALTLILISVFIM